MEEKIKNKLDSIESSMEDLEKRIDIEVAEFRKCANEFDARQITTYIQGRLYGITELLKAYDNLKQQKILLVHLLKGEN